MNDFASTKMKSHPTVEQASGELDQAAAKSYIHLPADQYAHLQAPAEWWWHIGTLVAGDKIFGFEINAARFTKDETTPYGFTQIMLSDIENQKHYSATTFVSEKQGFNPTTWAESDPSKPWHVDLDTVHMSAPQADPTKNMHVTATLDSPGNKDDAKGVVKFDLQMSQNGAPFIVWAIGATPPYPPNLKDNNYYYSLTNLAATGTITIDGQQHAVTGTTWMDHEYGLFGSSGDRPKWILQDMQLDNGVNISNFSVKKVEAGRPAASIATVQSADGEMSVMGTSVTPGTDVWISQMSGQAYYQSAVIEIPNENTLLTVKSLMPAQEFYSAKKGGSVYEGVAVVSGTYKGQTVNGTAWMEQTADSEN